MTTSVTDGGAGDPRARPLPSPVTGVALLALDVVPRRGDEALALLDEADRARLAVLPPDAAAALLARRALVAVIVAERTGTPPDRLRWTVTGRGRPSVTGPDGLHVALSVSTSRDRSLVALGTGPLGVDFEVVEPLPDAGLMAAALLPDPERDWVLAEGEAQATERFLRVWVRKEAVVKCTGEGLGGRSLRSFLVDGESRRALARDECGRSLGLVTIDVPVPGGVAAVAVPGHQSG